MNTTEKLKQSLNIEIGGLRRQVNDMKEDFSGMEECRVSEHLERLKNIKLKLANRKRVLAKINSRGKQ